MTVSWLVWCCLLGEAILFTQLFPLRLICRCCIVCGNGLLRRRLLEDSGGDLSLLLASEVVR